MRSLLISTALLAGTGMAMAETQVTIGVLTDMTGGYSEITGKGSITAAQLAADDFMASDAGKDFEVNVVSGDTQQKPDIASAIARRWYEVDGVDAIIDMPTTAIAMAVNELAVQMNKVSLITTAASSDLTGKACTPNSIQWTYDTWSYSNGTSVEVTKAGGNKWFYITADYVFGHVLERDSSRFVQEQGGEVMGSVRHPINSTDFASYLLQAQASGANVLGLANAGSDAINTIKQAADFGLPQSGMTIAPMILFTTDIRSLGLEIAQGMKLTTAYYWDRDDASRAFAARFGERMGGKMPTMVNAGAYAATLAYLQTLAQMPDKVEDGAAVVKAMEDGRVFQDSLLGPTTVLPNGRALHDMLFVEVKAPAESTSEWDVYKIISTIPANQAFAPLEASECALLK